MAKTRTIEILKVPVEIEYENQYWAVYIGFL